MTNSGSWTFHFDVIRRRTGHLPHTEIAIGSSSLSLASALSSLLTSNPGVKRDGKRQNLALPGNKFKIPTIFQKRPSAKSVRN